MKCSEKLVCIRVSRVVDGAMYMCVAVPIVPDFHFFDYWCQVLPYRHVT